MGKKALTKERTYKRALLRVSPDLLLDLIRIHPDGEVIDGKRITCVSGGIPLDATVRGCFIETDSNTNAPGAIVLVIQSDDLPSTREGTRLPVLNPVYSVDYLEA